MPSGVAGTTKEHCFFVEGAVADLAVCIFIEVREGGHWRVMGQEERKGNGIGGSGPGAAGKSGSREGLFVGPMPSRVVFGGGEGWIRASCLVVGG